MLGNDQPFCKGHGDSRYAWKTPDELNLLLLPWIPTPINRQQKVTPLPSDPTWIPKPQNSKNRCLIGGGAALVGLALQLEGNRRTMSLAQGEGGGGGGVEARGSWQHLLGVFVLPRKMTHKKHKAPRTCVYVALLVLKGNLPLPDMFYRFLRGFPTLVIGSNPKKNDSPGVEGAGNTNPYGSSFLHPNALAALHKPPGTCCMNLQRYQHLDPEPLKTNTWRSCPNVAHHRCPFQKSRWRWYYVFFKPARDWKS